MKQYYIKDLSDLLNQQFSSIFAIKEKSIRKTRSDKLFIRVLCVDKTGQVTGNIWDNVKSLSEKFTEGDIVKIKATTEIYSGNIQLNINYIRKAQENEYTLSDFYPKSAKGINKMLEQLLQFIDSIKNPYLNKLLHLFFDDKEFLKKFSMVPAAKSWHHNIIGGLISHTTNIVKMCDVACQIYGDLNRDLVLTGAILHDIGKIHEYKIKPFIDYSNKGKFIGHIVMGNKMVVDKIEQINNFPEEIKNKLQHLLLSHHGEREKGAVVLPKIPEAIILHYIDNLDAHYIGVKDLIEKARGENKNWTDFDHLTKREYYTK